MKKKPAPEALTEDETEFLRSSRVPEAIRTFVSRQHETIGTRTTAYKKVAAAAKSEREALWEVRLLELTKLADNGSSDQAQRVRELEAERRQLVESYKEMSQEVLRLQAAPAIAEHSEGTR